MVEFSGSFRVADALAQGVGRGALRSRHLSAPFQGVRSVTPPRDAIERCRAYATKMRRDAAFCGTSAARIWGIPLPMAAEDDMVHVSTPHGGPRPTGRGVRGYQHDAVAIEPVRRDGLRVFSPVDTWVSLARHLDLGDLVAAADYLLTAPFGSGAPPLVALEDLTAALTDRRMIGRPLLVKAVALALPGPLSRPESLCRVLLTSAGIPPAVANLRVNALVTLDLAWPEARVGLDYLGDLHRTPTQFARDTSRRQLIADLGWTFVEATREDLFVRPYHLVTRMRSRLSERGVSVRPVHPSKFVLAKP